MHSRVRIEQSTIQPVTVVHNAWGSTTVKVAEIGEIPPKDREVSKVIFYHPECKTVPFIFSKKRLIINNKKVYKEFCFSNRISTST